MASNKTGRDAARSGRSGKTKAVSGGGKRTGKGKGTTPGEGTPRLDYGPRGASDEDGRWRIPAGLQRAVRLRYAKRRGCWRRCRQQRFRHGKMAPMNEALAADYGERLAPASSRWRLRQIRRHRGSGKRGVEVYAPVRRRATRTATLTPRSRRCASIAAWRSAWLRSGKRHLQGVAATAECTNAQARKSWPASSFSCTGVWQGQSIALVAWPDTQHGVRLASPLRLDTQPRTQRREGTGIDRRSGDRPA